MVRIENKKTKQIRKDELKRGGCGGTLRINATGRKKHQQ